MPMRTMDAPSIRDIIERIDNGLDRPQTLCLIGSGATVLMGQPNRATEDLDVWKPASRFDRSALADAVRKARLLFDPKEEVVDEPYVQIVEPGIVQVPGYDEETDGFAGHERNVVWEGDHLTITTPPHAVIVASKMNRCSAQDIDDCIWLMADGRLLIDSVKRVVSMMGQPHREEAMENLESLSFLLVPPGPPRP